MDCLSLLWQRFSLRAGVFYAGRICGIRQLERDAQRGHDHLVKQEPVTITGGGMDRLCITEPTLLAPTAWLAEAHVASA